MMDTQISSNSILKHMDDGVMTLDTSGHIIMFNPAASKILGLDYNAVLNHLFAEIFMMDLDGNDEFNQIIIDAVSQKDVVHNSIVSFKRTDSSTIHLSVKATYIRSETGDRNIGVIVVFSDISELKQLEASQKKLNDELKSAYIQLEASNQSMLLAEKRKRMIRMIAIILTFIVILSISFLSYKKIYVRNFFAAKKIQHASTATNQNSKTCIVTTGPISTSITLTGKFEPLNTFYIISPFSGIVLEKMFSYGEKVKKGAVLLKLDASEIEVQLRDAKANFIKTKQEYEKILHWQDSIEVAQAKRQLNRAKGNLETIKKKFYETKALYAKGIVQRNEYEEIVARVKETEMGINEAQESLEKTIHQGNTDNLEVVRFAMMNAKIKIEELEKKRKSNIIYSPAEGIAIIPPSLSNMQDMKNNAMIEVGVMVQAGQTLLSIGNLDGFTVRTKVDEVDISKVNPGQTARVTVDAFPNIIMQGMISGISTQAGSAQSYGGSNFDMIVSVPTITTEQKMKIRIGMTARVEVLTYENPKALLVPLKSILLSQGKRTVMLKNKQDGNFSAIDVETGLTNLTSVEILSGLKEGDEILLRE
ncbi:MAG: HlyD family efflux transporter periplasmic adaptor subunit [Desulfobacterales bacterium]|nr:HlyD family efflux transporter periplasmic adaptor subunit [Desulfobacterales bacterium]